MTQGDDNRTIFLSYASEDRPAAARIARAVESHGFKVWWDADIPTGVHYPRFIEDALKAARCVVVLWSHHSTASRWVRNEADWGAENDTLVPVLIEKVEIPWEFRNFQTLDLADWNGDEHDPTFARLIQGLDHRVPRGDVAPEGDRQAPARPARKASPVVPRRPSRRRYVAAAALAAAALLLFIGYRSWDARSGGGAAAVRPADLAYTPLTGDGLTRSSGLSPDGNYLAYVPMDGDRSSLRVKQIETGSESVLVPEDRQGIRSPVFSPDGTYIYFAMAGPAFSMRHDAPYDLYRISMLGGDPQRIATGIVGRRFDCSGDGGRLVYKRTAGDSTLVQVAGSDGSGERTIAVEPRSLRADCCLAWSDRDDGIFTTLRDSITGFFSIVNVPAAGGTARPVGDRLWQAVLDLHALADGTGLLIVGRPVSDEKALNVDVWFLPAGGGPLRRITNDITFYFQASADASGDKLALTYYEAKRTLHVIDMKSGGEGRDVATDAVANGRVTWAGPGRLLANQRVGNRIGLVVLDLATGETRRIATPVDYVSELDLSPDGRRIAFTSFQGNDLSVWTCERDGGSPRRISAEEGNETFARFSPDGAWLATMYRAEADKPWTIRRRALSDGATQTVSPVPGRWPHISPDGDRIAAHFFDETLGGFGLGVVPAAGGEPVFLDVEVPCELLGWSPDGAGLTCFTREGSRCRILQVPLNGDAPRLLAETPPGALEITSGAWNAHGDSLAVCLQKATFDVMLIESPGAARQGAAP